MKRGRDHEGCMSEIAEVLFRRCRLVFVSHGESGQRIGVEFHDSSPDLFGDIPGDLKHLAFVRAQVVYEDVFPI